MIVWHIIEILLGTVFFNILFEGALICGGKGNEWHYTSSWGNIFTVMHVVGTM
jgi:hypothetical protein